MLKACWDCVAGSGVLRNGGENDGSYGIQLNGGSHSQRAPLRPARSEEANMYTLPRKLRFGDYVVVSGHHNNAETFTIDFLTGENYPDFNNTACQLEISEYGNTFTRRIIYDGKIDNENIRQQNGSFLKNGSTFDIKFQFEEFNGELYIKIYINNSSFDEFKVEHDIESINFLRVSENIQITALLFGYS